MRGRKWYPEDMTINPDAYLKGVDPEADSHGRKSALALWLELEKQGYMDSGLKKNAPILFENKVNQLR